ncbi:AAA family ATPase [Mycobacterium sp. CBMA293]|uniref:septum site-determining protein Ssd n=1 Tax=unclassified Mycolicibacterium TaxID=2636767 RepID=UPI0012DD3BD7|nr:MULTISPECIES: septum site-determining protein Ssd [unclassified Mycolicibacterium]MUL46054.1 AAA family ATPase [Mycolicibacterium sp. CBMA 360]MUL58899.1 AAA family ATPase [Mycolicibacterium sp. CBMA 335]MUL69293.1 AAA family ATPase [Mycolicibacterium sp. CBMA 311]MUL94257.1 AAA family ATPase [Mycolicibacterium sp. CBMA 230]MUM05272.1 AAA family ATPase [Mycolicibacterium sp. CBMA 213]
MATNGALALIADGRLRAEVERIAAAAGIRVVYAAEPSGRKVWAGAAAVLLDVAAAKRCRELGMPRRAAVLLIAATTPAAADFEAAMDIGAQQIVTLPGQESVLVGVLSEAAAGESDGCRGAVVAVIGGRGGGGASVFAIALAQAAGECLLVDVDPWGGGIDLALGAEGEAGLRWPDLAAAGGRLSYPALRDALPQRRGVVVLSAGRSGVELRPTALAAVVEAGSRGGIPVICDLPRQSSAVVETVLAAADLVVVVAPAEVRACAATRVVADWVLMLNPNVGLVVRGPAPGGLRAAEMATLLGLPLLAAMRAESNLDEALERGGLAGGLRRRSPLAAAARRVLAVLPSQPGEAA